MPRRKRAPAPEPVPLWMQTKEMHPGDLGYHRCEFVQAYVGTCGALLPPERRFCSAHAGKICSTPECGREATHECSYAGQFVCGVPLCDLCTDGTSAGPSGAWGFLNHIHRRRQDAMPVTATPMQEGDL